MAVPVIEASQWSENTSTSTSETLTAPSGITAGELLVLIFVHDALTWPTYNAITGWTRMATLGNTTSDSGSAIFYKIADGTEGNITGTSNQTDYKGGWYLRVSGAADYVGGVVSQTATLGEVVCASIDTPIDDCLAFYLVTADGADVGPFGQPTGWTEKDDQTVYSATYGVAAAYGTKSMATAGATGSATLTGGGAADGIMGCQFYIPPAPTTAGGAHPVYSEWGASAGTNFTIDVGAPGNNRLVVVGFSQETTTDSITAVTCDGKTMTEFSVSPAINTDGSGNVISLWYINESSLGTSAGANKTVAATGDTTSQAYFSAVFYNVGAQTDIGKDQTSVGDTFTVTNIDCNKDGLVLAFSSQGAGTTQYTSWTSPLVELEDYTALSNTHQAAVAWGIETANQTNKTYSATALTNVNRGTLIVVTFESLIGTLEQEGFRFRNDDGSESTATWIAAQDTDASVDKDINLRLRMLTDASGDPVSDGLKLQFRDVTGTPGAWTDVSGPGETDDGIPERLGSSTSGAGTTTSASGTLSIAAGNKRCLIVVAGREDANPLSTGPTVTYGGQSMSLIYTRDANSSSGYDNQVTIWYLNDAGIEAATSTTISVTNGGGLGTEFIAQAYTKVSQTTPTIGSSHYSTTGNPVTFTLSAVNKDLLISGSAVGNTQTSETWGGTNGLTEIASEYGTGLCSLSMADRVSAATETVTSSCTWGATPNRVCGAMIKIPGASTTTTNTDKVQLSASSNIVASGANTAARLTAPSGKTTADFGGGRIQDDENPTDNVDLAADEYREDEWCIKIQTSAGDSDDFEFRVVLSDGTLIDDYTVTPTLSVGSIILKTGSDTLGPKIVDSSGNALTTARVDALAVNLIDSLSSHGTMTRADTLNPQIDELSSFFISLIRTDTLSPQIEELVTLFVTLSRSDELKPLLVDAYTLFKFIQVAVSDSMFPLLTEGTPSIKSFLEKFISDSLLAKIDSDSYSITKIFWELFDYAQIDIPAHDYTYSEVENLRENNAVNNLFKFPWQMDAYGVVIGDFDTLADTSFGLGFATATAGQAITFIFGNDTLAPKIDEAVDMLNMFIRTDAISPQLTESLVNLLRSSRSDSAVIGMAEFANNLLRSSVSDSIDPEIIETYQLLVSLARTDDVSILIDHLVAITATFGVDDSLFVLIDDTMDILSVLSRSDELLPRIDDTLDILSTLARSDNLDITIDDISDLLAKYTVSDELAPVLTELAEILWLTLEAYRWREDDGSESGATWAGAQDTQISRAKLTNTRLRVLLDTSSDAPALQLKLQYKPVGDPDWEWRDVE